MPRWVKLLILADLKEQVTSPEKWQAKPVPLSDRQNRLAFLKKKLSGIIIAGPSEPSHALLDEATRMEREGTLRYIPAERCQTRLYEIQNTKTSSGSKVLELLEGKLAVKEDSPLGDITCSSVLLFQEALRRRGLALEFAGVGTYLEHERYIHKLFSYMGRDPPPDCQRTTVAQLMAADKALWTRMVEQGVSPQRSIEGSFPLDAALVPTLETYEVTIHLLPRFTGGGGRPNPRKPNPKKVKTTFQQTGRFQDKNHDDKKGGKPTKPPGKGANKGFVRIPDGIRKLGGSATTPDGKRICFARNLGGCSDDPCSKGLHVCALCFAPDHGIQNCPLGPTLAPSGANDSDSFTGSHLHAQSCLQPANNQAPP